MEGELLLSMNGSVVLLGNLLPCVSLTWLT